MGIFQGLLVVAFFQGQTPEAAIWQGSAEPCRAIPGVSEYAELPHASAPVRRLATVCAWRSHHAGLLNQPYAGAFGPLRQRALEGRAISARGTALTLGEDFVLPELLQVLLDMEKAGAITVRVCEPLRERAERNRRTAYRELVPVLDAAPCGVAEVLLPAGDFDDFKVRQELARTLQDGRKYLKVWAARHQRTLYLAINEHDPWGAELLALQSAVFPNTTSPVLVADTH